MPSPCQPPRRSPPLSRNACSQHHQAPQQNRRGRKPHPPVRHPDPGRRRPRDFPRTLGFPGRGLVRLPRPHRPRVALQVPPPRQAERIQNHRHSEYIRQYRIRSGDSIAISVPATEGAWYTISLAVDDAPLWREGEEIEEAEEAEDTEEGREGWAEGASQRLWVNRYERDPRNRQAAIQQHGVRCLGCDVEMAEVYGEIAKGYIHIHHIKPISAMQGARPPIEDLVPLCPNCHAIVHLETPPISIHRLQELIRQRGQKPPHD